MDFKRLTMAGTILFIRMVAVGAVMGAACRPASLSVIRPPRGPAPSSTGEGAPPFQDGA